MADGFDMFAAETVLSVKEINNSIRLIAVIPFDDGHKKSDKYNKIILSADENIVLENKFSKGTYFVRNE